MAARRRHQIATRPRRRSRSDPGDCSSTIFGMAAARPPWAPTRRVRAAGFPLAAPVTWEHVKKGVAPDAFTLDRPTLLAKPAEEFGVKRREAALLVVTAPDRNKGGASNTLDTGQLYQRLTKEPRVRSVILIACEVKDHCSCLASNDQLQAVAEARASQLFNDRAHIGGGGNVKHYICLDDRGECLLRVRQDSCNRRRQHVAAFRVPCLTSSLDQIM